MPPPAVPTHPDPPATPRVVAQSQPLATPVHRTRGDVRGGLEVDGTTFVAGAPIVWRFVVENAGTTPIAFQDGGDSYAQGPLHFTWLVRDAAGSVECDLRASPEPMAGGGGSSKRVLAPGERIATWLAPQVGCPALSVIGRHRLRVVRILTQDGEAPASCSTILVPDTTTTPIDDRGVTLDRECEAFLLASPAVASEVEIEVVPYDVDAVRAAIRAALRQPAEQRRQMLGRYAIWLAFRLDLDPNWGAEPDVELERLMAALPVDWPAPAEQ